MRVLGIGVSEGIEDTYIGVGEIVDGSGDETDESGGECLCVCVCVCVWVGGWVGVGTAVQYAE